MPSVQEIQTDDIGLAAIRFGADLRSLLQTSNGSKLLELCDEAGAQIARTFTHEDFAHMICSSRETVSRLLAILNRRRIICVTPNNILISDRAALQKLAAG
jgi:CRP-like cAMP-binding protein